jgi:hypothetical protein
MPWKETDPMKERVRFIQDWLRRSHSVAELCAMYGISRKVIVRRPPSLTVHSLAFSRALTSSMSKARGSKGRPIHSLRSACSG